MSVTLTYTGYGISPAGTSPFGGMVDTLAERVPSRMFQQPNGRRPNSTAFTGNLLDESNDWVLDPEGRPYGDSQVKAKVRLILTTRRGSSLDPNFGLRKFPEIISPSALAQLKVDVAQALKDLVDSGEITIVSVDITNRLYGRVGIDLRFIDRTRETEETLEV